MEVIMQETVITLGWGKKKKKLQWSKLRRLEERPCRAWMWSSEEHVLAGWAGVTEGQLHEADFRSVEKLHAWITIATGMKTAPARWNELWLPGLTSVAEMMLTRTENKTGRIKSFLAPAALQSLSDAPYWQSLTGSTWQSRKVVFRVPAPGSQSWAEREVWNWETVAW